MGASTFKNQLLILSFRQRTIFLLLSTRWRFISLYTAEVKKNRQIMICSADICSVKCLKLSSVYYSNIRFIGICYYRILMEYLQEYQATVMNGMDRTDYILLNTPSTAISYYLGSFSNSWQKATTGIGCSGSQMPQQHFFTVVILNCLAHITWWHVVYICRAKHTFPILSEGEYLNFPLKCPVVTPLTRKTLIILKFYYLSGSFPST